MKRLIIVGSPRSNGRSAHLAEMLFEANIDERPEDELFLVPVSEVEIGPCIGCGACRRETGVTFKNDAGEEVTEMRHRCVFDDDMQTLYDLLDETDELTIVSPVYFSGAPAPMKCVLDRMQPYFWVNQWNRDKSLSPDFADAAGTRLKRSATLHVIGEGGDPHGFEPLVAEVKSSLACAGFRLERIFNWVGKIDESGEITAEADEYEMAPKEASSLLPVAQEATDEGGTPSSQGNPTTPASRKRPKLDLSSGANYGEQTDRKKAGRRGPSSPKGNKPSGSAKSGNANRNAGSRKGKRRG